MCHLCENFPVATVELMTAAELNEQFRKANKVTEPPKPKEPLVIYVPPPEVSYILKDGRMVCDIPVYDQESAYAAAEKMVGIVSDFIRGGHPVDPYKFQNPKINIARLFEVEEYMRNLLDTIKRT